MPWIIQEIQKLAPDLDRASDLIFHVIQLSNDWDGPSVTVYGEEGQDNVFYAIYSESTKWRSIDDLEKE